MTKDSIVAYIEHGNSSYYMTLDGRITGANWKPSGNWKVTGAVRCNNFGHVTQRYTLADIIADLCKPYQERIIQWKNANGTQRTHILDNDHGTGRMWGCPRHSLSPMNPDTKTFTDRLPSP